MKKTFLYSVLIFLVLSCSKQVPLTHQPPPLTYDELLKYNGTNESLYKYLIHTWQNDPQLFNEWYIEMNNPEKLLHNQTERVALLLLFSLYFSVIHQLIATGVTDINFLQETRNKHLARFINPWQGLIKTCKIKVKQSDVDELTNFFLTLDFEKLY